MITKENVIKYWWLRLLIIITWFLWQPFLYLFFCLYRNCDVIQQSYRTSIEYMLGNHVRCLRFALGQHCNQHPILLCALYHHLANIQVSTLLPLWPITTPPANRSMEEGIKKSLCHFIHLSVHVSGQCNSFLIPIDFDVLYSKIRNCMQRCLKKLSLHRGREIILLKCILWFSPTQASSILILSL